MRRKRTEILTLIFAALTAAAQTAPDWGASFAEGERLNRQGHYEEAFHKYETAAGAALDAKHAAEAQYRMAQMYKKLGDPAQALLWYKKSLEKLRDEDTEAAIKRLELARPDPLIRAGEIATVLRSSATKSAYVEPSIDLPVRFETDQASLTREGMEQVNELGSALGDPALASGRFQIIGHTDRRGTARHNQELSLRRAETVRNALAAQFHINAARLEVIGKGAAEPLFTGDTPEDYRLNRRVEVKWIR